MMVRLDSDPHVVKWMKRHGITIPWIDGQKHQRRYCPDFLVEYEAGQKAIIEVKDPSRLDSPDVQRKRKAAEFSRERIRGSFIELTSPLGDEIHRFYGFKYSELAIAICSPAPFLRARCNKHVPISLMREVFNNILWLLRIIKNKEPSGIGLKPISR